MLKKCDGQTDERTDERTDRQTYVLSCAMRYAGKILLVWFGYSMNEQQI